MRRVRLERPLIGGMVTDQPTHKVGPRETAFAQDLIAPSGVATQRHGWLYDGTTADVAANLIGIHRAKLILADTTATITTDAAGEVWLHNSGAAGTAIATSTNVKYLPRTMYRDQVILCAQDGTNEMLLWSGSTDATQGTLSGLPKFTLGEATVTNRSLATGPTGIGSYLYVNLDSGDRMLTAHRVIETTTDTWTLEDVLVIQDGDLSTTRCFTSSVGRTWPAVSVYDAGSLTIAALTATGYGTKWSTGDWGSVRANLDGVLSRNGTQEFRVGIVTAVTDDDTMTVRLDAEASKVSYNIMRRCPFKDAAAHKGSLWGTGVAQFPNNVYVSRPGWNPAIPPGFDAPFDPTIQPYSTNPNDFLLDSIAVPTAYEGDVNVAILSSPNPLLVLKRSAVYGIFGSYPNFSTDKIADGVGCIDLRSAISGPNGQFWAGEDGIYAYVGGQVIDLTQGKINREWRRATSLFDYGVSDYCTIGESNDHLLVSLVTNGGADDYCYVYDLRAQAWMSKWTNHKARYFFSSKVDGESSELYWVGDDDQGRVMTSSGCFDRNGLIGAKDGDSTSPIFRGWTGEGFDGTQSIDNDSRVLDVAISHNVYDVGAAGSTTVLASLTSSGRRESPATRSVTLGTISSDTVDRVDRTRYRPNVAGRLHQLRIGVTTLGTNDGSTLVEIPEITATIRDRRPRT